MYENKTAKMYENHNENENPFRVHFNGKGQHEHSEY